MFDFIISKCNKENLKKILMIFLTLQPLLDTYILFEEKTIEIFRISPSTVIRLIFIFIIAIMGLFVIKSKKQWISYIIYFILVIVYSFLHFYNATQFNSYTPGNFNYSFTTELFYIIRMLIPLFIIIISSNIKFSTASINRFINVITLLISGTIVITNILKISIGAYVTKFINLNIFDWFTKNIYASHTFYDTATRGYFSFANMISALLFGTTAMLFYQLFKKFNYKTILIIIIQMVAMFMLGTKVATFGFLLSAIAMSIIYIFFVSVKKEIKFNYKVILLIFVIIISWIIIYPYSPCKNRITGVDIMEEQVEETDKNDNVRKIDYFKNKVTDNDEILSDEEKENLTIEFVKNNYKDFAIKEEYILKKYPYQYDPYFWYSTMKLPFKQKTDNRFLITSILDRLKEINKRQTMDDMFGLTYSRMSNIGVLERDFLAQYYTLGIMGFIFFISPYIIILFISIIYILINYKTNVFKLKNVSIIVCLFSGLIGSYYCGNVLDNLTFSILYAFLYGQLIRNVFIKKEIKKLNNDEITILALHLGVGGVEKYISSLCKMLNKKYKINIISTYKLSDKPAFDYGDANISYLILDKPYVLEMKAALKSKQVFKFIKFLLKNIKLYILRYIRNVKAIKNIKSKYVITTRTFHNNIVNVELDRNYVKIATEHNYHNNDNHYVKNLVSSINNFDYLVCVSEELKNYYENKVVNVKVVFIPNTIDNIPSIENKKLNKNIISVGRFSKEKGFIDLIEVFNIIHKKDKDTKLTLVGDGEEFENIKQKIDLLNLNDCVNLTGFIKNQNQLSKLYKNASIYLMTSFTESFGIVLIEAMSNGVVCAAFDSANGAKMLLSNTGILVSNRNKQKLSSEVIKIINNENKWNEYSKKSYNYSKKYDVSEVSKEWLKLLGEDK